MSKNKNYTKIVGALFACLCVISLSLQPLAVIARSSTSSQGEINADYQRYKIPAPKIETRSTVLSTTTKNNSNNITSYSKPISPQQRYINLFTNSSTPKSTPKTTTTPKITITPKVNNTNTSNSLQKKYINLFTRPYNVQTFNQNSTNTTNTYTPKTTQPKTQSQNKTVNTTSKVATTPKVKNTNTSNSLQKKYINLFTRPYNVQTFNQNSTNTTNTYTPKTTQPKTQSQNKTVNTTSKVNRTNTYTPKISYKKDTISTIYSYTAPKTTSTPKNTTPKIASNSYNLKPTEIKWITIPSKHSTKNKLGSAKIAWGGGSLHQLISRLAIEGCNIDKIEIGQYRYYDTGNSNTTFLNRYKNNIANNTTINITCIDNCSILKGPGQGAASQRDRCKDRNAYVTKKYAPVNITTPCGNYFSNFARNNVLTRLPIFQDTCIAKYTASSTSKTSSWNGFTFSPMRVANGKMYQNYTTGIYLNQNKANAKTEVHELCHVNQSWYTQKMFMNNSQIARSIGKNKANAFREAWYDTPAGREFIQITGQKRNGQIKNGQIMWSLPPGSDLKKMANNYTPHELAAETCALYFMQDVDPVAATLLTPRMEAYIEKYFVLPRV